MTIVYRTFSPEEKHSLQLRISKSHEVLQGIANRKDRPIKDMVQQVRSGKLIVTKAESEVFSELPLIEELVLEAYGKLAFSLARRFYSKEKEFKPDADCDDYSQEAMFALVNSIYYYDGSVEFSTYATIAIRNGLRTYVASESPLSPITRRIFQLRMKVNREMDKYNISFDEAVSKLGLSQADQKEILQSLVRTVNEGDAKWDFPVSDIDYAVKAEEGDLILQALNLSNLSDFERDLVLANMNGEKIVSVTKRYEYSRMAGTLALRKALGIIKSKYDELTAA